VSALAREVGGTWHWNTYPGLAVDISSLTYAYSFEPNPHWSRLFAPGRELKAYEGISIPGFPNLFYLPSPYSYTGLSYFWTIEGQMKHIARCLRALKQRQATRIEIDDAKTTAFRARMQSQLRDSVFRVGHCTPANSYYFDPHGEPSLLRPTPVLRAHYEHAHFAIDDYHFS
jgi:cation diffusion facilitator CzcD-associated flavoprotein CzcO